MPQQFPIDAHDPQWLIRACGGVALAGCATVLVLDLLGAHLSDHLSMMSETISNLAARGRYAWLEDAGLYVFVLAVLAAALGLSRWRADDWRWKAGQALLVLLAADIFAIAAYEAYSYSQGWPNLHYYFVYFLGLAFPVTIWLTAPGLAAGLGGGVVALRIFAIVWALCGPVLFVLPTGWDGLYERALAFFMVLWFATVGWVLLFRPAPGN